MNQKKIFYLLSLIVIFFIGHYYSQFNNKPIKPEIITINNSIKTEEYRAKVLRLQLQLDELDSQLISSLNELKITKQKLTIASSKIQVLENELISTNKINKAELKENNNSVSERERALKIIKDSLLETEIDLEITKFELELAEELLEVQ